MKPELIEQYGDYPAMFCEMFSRAMAAQAGNCELLIDSSDVYTDEPLSIDAFNNADALLITGSAASAYENKAWINRLKELVRLWVAEKKKLLGICFGHQLVAEALGGKVTKCERGWGVGRREVAVLRSTPWMGDEKAQSIALLYSHQDQVEQLPATAQPILGDAFCPVAGFVIDDQVMTLQGHPEFSVAYVSELIQRRKAIIGEDNAERALQASQLFTDAEAAVAPRWMVNFLCSDLQKTS